MKAELRATDSNRTVIKQEYEVVCAELAVAHETQQRNAFARRHWKARVSSLKSSFLILKNE